MVAADGSVPGVNYAELVAFEDGVAVLATAGAVRPAQPDTTPVVVAAHDLPAGTVLGADDVTVVELPPGAAPADSSEVEDVVELPAGCLQAASALYGLADRLLGVCRLPEALVLLLDIDRLVPDAGLGALSFAGGDFL